MTWGQSRRSRWAAAAYGVVLLGVVPIYQDRNHPAFFDLLYVAGALVFAVICLRSDRVTIAGDRLVISSILRTRQVRAADIAGMVPHPERPQVLVIWTLQRRHISTGALHQSGRAHRDAFPQRMAQVEKWWLANRGANWSLETLASVPSGR